MAAQLEEVVGDADAFYAEEVAPHRFDQLLGLGARGDELGGKLRPRVLFGGHRRRRGDRRGRTGGDCLPDPPRQVNRRHAQPRNAGTECATECVDTLGGLNRVVERGLAVRFEFGGQRRFDRHPDLRPGVPVDRQGQPVAACGVAIGARIEERIRCTVVDLAEASEHRRER